MNLRIAGEEYPAKRVELGAGVCHADGLPWGRLKPVFEFARAHRSPDIKSLGALATHHGQGIQRFLVLDAFGDDAEVEIVRQIDHRLDDAPVRHIRDQVADKQLVNLEDIDRQLF